MKIIKVPTVFLALGLLASPIFLVFNPANAEPYEEKIDFATDDRSPSQIRNYDLYTLGEILTSQKGEPLGDLCKVNDAQFFDIYENDENCKPDVPRSCTGRAVSVLRLKIEKDGLEIKFEVESTKFAGAANLIPSTDLAGAFMSVIFNPFVSTSGYSWKDYRNEIGHLMTFLITVETRQNPDKKVTDMQIRGSNGELAFNCFTKMSGFFEKSKNSAPESNGSIEDDFFNRNDNID